MQQTLIQHSNNFMDLRTEMGALKERVSADIGSLREQTILTRESQKTELERIFNRINSQLWRITGLLLAFIPIALALVHYLFRF